MFEQTMFDDDIEEELRRLQTIHRLTCETVKKMFDMGASSTDVAQVLYFNADIITKFKWRDPAFNVAEQLVEVAGADVLKKNVKITQVGFVTVR
jgi:hypothetical protein